MWVNIHHPTPRRKGISIRWKLVLAIVLPLIIAASINLIYNYRVLRERSLEQMARLVEADVELQALRFDGHMARIAQVARTTAASLGNPTPPSEEHLFHLLEAGLAGDSLIYGACIAYEPGEFDPSKKLYAPYVYRKGEEITRLPLHEAYDYTTDEWPWYAEIKRTRIAKWTEPYFDEGAGNAVMCTYSAPILDGDRFIGVATVDVALHTLRNAVPVTDLQGYSGFAIFSREERVISANDPSQLMTTTLSDMARMDDSLQMMAAGIREGQTGVGLVQNFPASGARNFIAYTSIPSTEWMLAVGILESEVMAPVYRALWWRLMSSLALVAVAVTVVLLLSFRLTRPIEILASAVRRVSDGDLTVRATGIRSNDEIGDLAQSFNTMVQQIGDQIEEIKVQTAARQEVEVELKTARKIQVSLLPQTFPPFPARTEFQLHAVNAPARHMAGDFFDFRFVNEDELLLIIADVSGKGVPAAMFMAVTRTLLHQLVTLTQNPADIMRRTNEVLESENTSGLFVTLIVGLYNVKTGVFRFCNAAHPPALLITTSGDIQEGPAPSGTVVGVLPGLDFTEESITLQPGETLIFITDGVPEARSPEGEFYGDPRFKVFLKKVASEPVQGICSRIIQEMDEFQNHVYKDDVTILAIRRASV